VKVGLYGGRFDPIHIAHLIIAQYVKENLALDRIILVPSAFPPHKGVCSDKRDRLKMVQLAIEDNANLECSDYELMQEGVNFSVDTIAYYKSSLEIAKENLFWIMGSDNFLEFSNWRDPDKISELCQVVIFPRRADDLARVQHGFKSKAIYLQDAPILEISSTAIRNSVHTGRSIKYLVSPKVETFIKKHNIYA
jgi:nicotinate-nucleotide adenylyltransferase